MAKFGVLCLDKDRRYGSVQSMSRQRMYVLDDMFWRRFARANDVTGLGARNKVVEPQVESRPRDREEGRKKKRLDLTRR